MGPLRLGLTPLLFLLVRGEAECGTSGVCSEGEKASAMLQTLHVTQPHDLVELKENSEEEDEVEGEAPPDLGEMPDEDEMILDDPADDPALPMMGEEQDEDDSLLNIEEETELGSHPALLEETVDGVKYTFELGGGSATVSGKESTECKGPSSLPEGGSGPVSISTMKYGSSCWTDGRYNSLDYKLELGKVTGSDGSAYTAARVSAPMKPASVGWVASQAMLYYKMPKSGDLKVSKLVGTSLVPQKTINGAPTGYVKTDIKVSKLSSAAVFVFDDGVEPSAGGGGGGGSSGAAASCSDSTTYKDPQWGDNCAAWANYDCSGHSYSDALKKACPKSCKVDCTPSTSGGGGGGSSTEFQPSGISKVLSGRSATACKKDVGAKSSSVIDSNFGLATGAYHGSCYPWGGYSNADFKVEKGTAGGTTVYNVYPPQTKATSFTAGGTWIFYKFSSKVAHTVYKLEDGNFNEYKTVSAGSITSGQFTDIKVRVDNLKEATMFAIVPSSQKPGTGGGGGGGGSSPSPPPPVPAPPAPAPAPGPPPAPAGPLAPVGGALQPLQQFNFQQAKGETMTWTNTGGSKTLKGNIANQCKGQMDKDTWGNVGLVCMRKNNKCICQKGYTDSNFKVEAGSINGKYVAYKFHPAATKATAWVWSPAGIVYKFPTKEDYKVYSVVEGAMALIAEVKASDINTGTYTYVGFSLNRNKEAMTVAIVPATTKMPDAGERTLAGNEATECDGTFDKGTLKDVSVASERTNKKNCQVKGRYGSGDYKVEYGQLKGSKGDSYDAYVFHPAATPATQFIAGRHAVWYKVPKACTLTVWRWDGYSFHKDREIKASKAGWVEAGIPLSGKDSSEEPVTYVFDTEGKTVSSWHQLGDGAEGAQLTKGGGFRVNARKFQVGGHPFNFKDWNAGPGTHTGNYGHRRQFWRITHSDGRDGICWYDWDTADVMATYFDKDLKGSKTSKIYNMKGWRFTGCVSNGQNYVLFLVSEKNGPNKDTGTDAKAVKISVSSNQVLKEKKHNTQKKAPGLNLWKDSPYGSSMVWERGTDNIGMVLSRTMTRASDGLNHQGAILMVINGNTLDLVVNEGQSSSHEFGNSLTQLSDGRFMTIETGDAFPRGVQTCQFVTDESKNPACLTAFLTKKTVGMTNYVYEEIAHPGLSEQDDAIIVFFTAESTGSYGPLSKIPPPLAGVRNVAFSRVSKDYFDKANKKIIQQRKWLTFGNDKQKSASRLKTAKLDSGNTLLYWEEWGEKTYTGTTKFMLVDKKGNKVRGPWTSSYPMNLHHHDEVFQSGKGAVAYMGSGDSIIRYELCGESC